MNSSRQPCVRQLHRAGGGLDPLMKLYKLADWGEVEKGRSLPAKASACSQTPSLVTLMQGGARGESRSG